MRKPQFKNKAVKGAFTLIEILVVLVIMGFLVSLVAPKLSGIVDSAVDTNCDTNQERLRKVLNVYVAQNGTIPSGLTNMVITDGGTNNLLPSQNDGDPANGAEFMSDEFMDRFLPQIHIINQDEAKELAGLGVKGFKYLAKVDDVAVADADSDGQMDAGKAAADDIVEMGVRGEMKAGTAVMMAGLGYDGTDITWSTGNTITINESTVAETDTALAINAGTATNASSEASDKTLARMDEGKNVGRILMGVSNDGELVQSGLLDASGTCPGQLQNDKFFSWGNYIAVLPRLAATMKVIATDLTVDVDDVKLHAVALDEDASQIEGRTPNSGYPYFGAQEVSDLTTSCPEGHTWGANADAYGIKVQ